MSKNVRFVSVLAVAAVAAASQAVIFSFSGQTPSGASLTASFTSSPPPGAIASQSPFNAITSGLVSLNTATLPGRVVFSAGADSVTVAFDPTPKDLGSGLSSLSSIGTIVAGTGAFAAYVSPSNTLTVTSNTYTTGGINFFSVLGNVNPVPEPASLAALAVGGLGLARRRRKA